MVDGRPPDGAGTALIGRDEELAAVRRALQGPGCVIAGALGVGKSRLASDAVPDGATVLRAVATATARSLPFGALSHLLPAGVEIGHGVVPAFLRTLADGDTILLVDDAHFLDEASATLVHAVVTARAARVLVTVRSHEPTPDAISSLWKDEALERIELQHLGRRDVRQLVTEMLGADVHAVAHDRLLDLTQGNPLFVRELVRDALRTGALQRVRDRWEWREELLEFDRIRLLVERRIQRVSAPARTAMELLAVGAPLPLAVVCELASAEAVEELERADLISVQDHGSREVFVAHPMYAEVVASGMPVTAALRHRRRLALAMSAEATDPGTQLRVATWLLDAGERDPDLFVEASRAALGRGAPELARRLAAAAGSSVAAAIAHASALTALARFDDADATLAPYEDEAAVLPEAAAESYLEVRVRAVLRGLADDGQAEALLDRATAWHASEDWEVLIATQRAWISLFLGKPQQVLDQLDGIAVEPRRPFQRFTVVGLRGLAFSRLGRVDECIAAAAAISALEGEFDSAPWEVGFAKLALDVSPRIQVGRDLFEAQARLSAARADAARTGDEPLRVAATAAMGALALRRGHADDAVAHLQAAVDDLAVADPANIRAGVLADLAAALALRGDVAAAEDALRRALERISDRPMTRARWHAEMVAAQALVTAAAGRLSDAGQLFVDLAGDDRATDLFAAQALHDAVAVGVAAAEVVDRLAALAADLDEAMIWCYSDDAAAIATRDPKALVTVAERYGALGLDLDAANAAAVAARMFHDDGRLGSSRRCLALAQRFAQQCGGAVIRSLSTTVDVPALSAREHEIALLVANGLSNREIAEQLVLSIRTVESTVLRACRKLGVDNRHALAELVGA